MLVHKASKGVLAEITVSGHGGVWIRKVNLKLSMFPELNPSDWFEVPDHSALGKKCKMYYPYMVMIVKEGKLVDVVYDHPVDDE